MISSIIDLLNSIKKQGVENIEEFLYLKHGPTIGAMYEGLTKELMNKAIFKNLDLRVCSGFIQNQDKKTSKQIDCMIVIGEGNSIPYTEGFVYDINQVIAVIEVKKDLFSKDLESAYQNLLSVKDVVKPDQDMKIDRLEQAYENITGKKLPILDKIKDLSENEQYLYHALVVEAYMPIRITFGYGGFSTEKSFREAFYNYLTKNFSKKGYRIASLPSILIAGDNSILKTNGMPYTIISNNQNCSEWIAMGSCNSSPLMILINLIWTRMYYLFDNLPESIFDNIEISINPLLKVKGTKRGWEYTFIETNLNNTKEENWKPYEISLMSNAILKMIEQGNTISIDNKDIEDVCKENEEEFKNILNDLQFKRIITIVDNNIEILPDSWLTVIYNGKYYFGDNFNNRMFEWIGNLKKD